MYSFLFSGQGSHIVGMGKDLYDNFASAKEIFDSLDDTLSMHISKIIFDGPITQLHNTKIAQPALFATCIAITKVLEEIYEEKITSIASHVLGHSLGQYAALYTANVITLQHALYAIKQRAIAMQIVCDETSGTMIACLNSNASQAELVVRECSHKGIIGVANYNSSSQIVLSGHPNAILEAKIMLAKQGVKCVDLPVSGAFHTDMMIKAAEDFEKHLDHIDFFLPNIKVIDNIDAKPITDIQQMPLSLKKHITSPVRWSQSINYCLSDCKQQDKKTIFVEISPKPVLSSMIKRDKINAKVYCISDLESIKAFVKDEKN